MEFESGRSNIFNIDLWGDDSTYPYVNISDGIYTGQDVYWVESLGNPNGRIAVKTNAKQGTDVITGLNLPGSFILHKHDDTDYLMVADNGGGSGGALYLYDLSTTPATQTTLVSGLQGDTRYIALDDPTSNEPYLYYAVDAGGTSSVLGRIEPYADTPTPEIISSSLSNVHHVYVYKQYIPSSATDPDTGASVSVQSDANTFVFVTERLATPNGRVLMYNVTNWDGSTTLTPVDITAGGGQNLPSKVTFVPDIQEYEVAGDTEYGHAYETSGTVYWTNYASNTGEVWGANLVLNSALTNMELSGTSERVATSLRLPYDIIGPNDFRYLFTTFSGTNPVHTTGNKYNVWNSYENSDIGLFNRLYVSRNESRADGGNYYEIDLDSFTSGTPLTPGSGVSSYVSESAQFPLNGKMQVYLYDPSDGTVPQAYRIDLFFTGKEFSVGSDDTYIYIYKNKFSPPGE